MDFNSASEKSSDYVKRVLFGGSSTNRPAAIASTRSESHSSTSSTPGSAVFGVPGTPRVTTAGEYEDFFFVNETMAWSKSKSFLRFVFERVFESLGVR